MDDYTVLEEKLQLLEDVHEEAIEFTPAEAEIMGAFVEKAFTVQPMEGSQ